MNNTFFMTTICATFKMKVKQIDHCTILAQIIKKIKLSIDASCIEAIRMENQLLVFGCPEEFAYYQEKQLTFMRSETNQRAAERY